MTLYMYIDFAFLLKYARHKTKRYISLLLFLGMLHRNTFYICIIKISVEFLTYPNVNLFIM